MNQASAKICEQNQPFPQQEFQETRIDEILQQTEESLRQVGDDLPNCVLYQILQDPINQSLSRYNYISAGVEKMFGVTAEYIKTERLPFYALMAAEDQERMLEARIKVMGTRQPFDVEARYRTPQGRVRWYRFRSVSRLLPGDACLWNGIIIDVTDTKQNFEELIQSIEGIIWEGEIDDTSSFQMTFISQFAERLLGYPAIYWLENPNFQAEHIHPDDQALATEASWRGVRNRTGVDIEYRLIAADGRIVWVREVTKIVSEENHRFKLRGLIVDITERKLAEDAVRQSNELIKNLAGKLITAQEDERKRIARELHDDLNQQVAALAIGISRLKRWLPDYESDCGVPTGDSVNDQLANLQQRTMDLSEHIRQMSHQLHSSTLEHAGLAAALKSLCGEFGVNGPLNVELKLPGSDVHLSQDIALCLYRIAQEALRNIVKHAQAHSAAIELAVTDAQAILTIRDDGVGFDDELARRAGGLGLVSMEERVRMLDGQLRIQSKIGVGTELRASIPTKSAIKSSVESSMGKEAPVGNAESIRRDEQ